MLYRHNLGDLRGGHDNAPSARTDSLCSETRYVCCVIIVSTRLPAGPHCYWFFINRLDMLHNKGYLRYS